MADSFAFDKIEPCYTGDNTYVFFGRLQDGSYFVATSLVMAVRLLNDDPDQDFGEDEYTKGFYESWMEEHLIRDLHSTSEECKEFWTALLEEILKKRPDGNYLLGDMEVLLNGVKNNFYNL